MSNFIIGIIFTVQSFGVLCLIVLLSRIDDKLENIYGILRRKNPRPLSGK